MLHLLSEVCAPTLVLHRRDDRIMNLANSRVLAGGIPGAELVILEGSTSLPHGGDQSDVIRAVGDFIRPVVPVLTRREIDVMRMVAEGMSNRHIGLALDITEHTVARHLANVFIKLDVNSRIAAVTASQSLGLLAPPSTHWVRAPRPELHSSADAAMPLGTQHLMVVRVSGDDAGGSRDRQTVSDRGRVRSAQSE